MNTNLLLQEHFITNQGIIKVTLYPQQLHASSSHHTEIFNLSHHSFFHLLLDHYGNPTTIVISTDHTTIQLQHKNPTILIQWECKLSSLIHKTYFSNDYQPLSKVSSGATASIHLAIHRNTQQKVAVKVLNRHQV